MRLIKLAGPLIILTAFIIGISSFGSAAWAAAGPMSAATYPFTSSSGNALEDMSTGTRVLFGPDETDYSSTAVTPIGFEFWMDGARQTWFSVDVSGHMKLGVEGVHGDDNNDLASAINEPQIAPYWDVLSLGNNGKVHYKVVGAAPNRKLVVEWLNQQIPGIGPNTVGAGTFQVWLYETSGKIEFVYGPGMAVNTGHSGYSVGIGSSATSFASVTTAGGTVAYGTANNTQTNAIASGTKYTFTPNAPSEPGPLSFTAVGLNAMTLNWADTNGNEVGYAIYRSVDGVKYDFIRQTAANATFSAESGLASNTTWYWKVSAVTEGGVSPASSGSQATATGALAGTFSVGPTGAYAGIGAALADIDANGLSGDVILELQPAYVSTAETFPLAIKSLGSPSNTITIRPGAAASGLSIAGSTAAPTVNLDGATNVVIDGRAGGAGASQLTISNTSTSGLALQLVNGASRNRIEFCTMAGVNTSLLGGVVRFSFSNGLTGNNDNTIDSCDVRDGATTPTNGIFALGTSIPDLINTGNTISNNNIFNYFSATASSSGIALNLNTSSTSPSNKAWSIVNNRLFQTASRTTTAASLIHSGILVSGGSDHVISGNTVGFGSPAGTGVYTMLGSVANVFYGIHLNTGCGRNSVQGNTVAGIADAVAGGAFYGIGVTSGCAEIGSDAGNTVGSGTGTGSIVKSAGGGLNGIEASGRALGTINIANNVVGALTAAGSMTVNVGISGISVGSGAPTITNNSIGSSSTANSIIATTPGTSATTQGVTGLFVGVTVPTSVTANTIANLTNAGTASTHTVVGLYYGLGAISGGGAGIGTISQNSIHDIAGASTNPTLGNGVVAVQGLLYTAPSAYGASIDRNTITAVSATNTGAVASVAAGIRYLNPANGTITRNKVCDIRNASTGNVGTAPPLALGISIGSTRGSGVTLANNMVSLGADQTTNTEFVGIMNNVATTGLFSYDNSVLIAGAASAGGLPTYAFLRGDNTAASAITTPVDVRNNIFQNARTGGAGKHYAIGNVNTAPATGWAATASNNNVLNSPAATTVGHWGPGTDRTIGQWQSSSGGDGASLSGSPVPFAGACDLHVNFGLMPTPIESGGQAIGGITSDFDGELRPGPAGSVNGGGAAPDIGADEFDGVPLIANDVRASGFIDPANGAAKAIDVSFSPQASFTNSGTAGQTGITVRFRILAGISEVYNQTATIASLAAGVTTTVGFPATHLTSGTYTMKARSECAGDQVPADDEISGSFTVEAPLCGNYDVGASGAFAALTNPGGAFAKLNNLGMSCSVTFSIVSDLTGETGSVPVNQWAESGVGGYTLTIKPGGAPRSITGASTGSALITLHGADRTTIDGSTSFGADRSLSIVNTGLTGAVIWIASAGAVDGADNDTVKNCVISGVQGTTIAGILSGGGTALGDPAEAPNSNDTIQNNVITKVQNAAYLLGNATSPDLNWVVSGNAFGSTLAAEKLSLRGLVMGGAQAFTIAMNTIYGVVSSASSNATVSGIQLVANIADGTITRNAISDIKQTNVAGRGSNGILLAASTAATGVVVSDNFIWDVASQGSSGVDQADNGYGIVVASGGGYGIYDNSVNLNSNQGANAASGNSAAVNVLAAVATAGSIDLRDNILGNVQTLGAAYALINSSTVGPAAFSAIDFNDYFAPSVGLMGTTQEPTLFAWAEATGQDQHSLAADPLFVSPTDLHIQVAGGASPVENAGTPLAAVANDADGELRDPSATDIGADEIRCHAAVDPACDDGNPCTVDTCAPATGCMSAAGSEDAPCSDGNPCTTGDACANGVCTGIPAPPPAAVSSSLRVDGTPAESTVSWNDLPGPYNVYRGSNGSGVWRYDQMCFSARLSGDSIQDIDVPAPDEFFYYLVTRTDSCTESTLGAASSGATRPNDSSCPAP